MPLWQLLNPPAQQDGLGWDNWFFAHAKDHEEIATAIQSQKSKNLIRYNLQEFDRANPDRWLQWHQLAHNDMIQASGANVGSDLSQLDFRNASQVQGWISQNFTEHQDVRAVLKI